MVVRHRVASRKITTRRQDQGYIQLDKYSWLHTYRETTPTTSKEKALHYVFDDCLFLVHFPF